MNRRRFPGWTTRHLSARTAAHGKPWTASAWLRLSRTPSSRSSTATNGRNKVVKHTTIPIQGWSRKALFLVTAAQGCFFMLLQGSRKVIRLFGKRRSNEMSELFVLARKRAIWSL
nr:MAG TPA: hypothetical protein [Caudoviricetes sp.]